jgi:inosine/uridine nucleosidase
LTNKIILDCDPGHDDAVAILLAHGNPDIELAAITTVAGNQTLDKVTLNARRVADLASIDGIPIAAGCDRPLLRELVTAPEIHGETGLDGPDWPEPAVDVVPEHAVDVIVDLVMGSNGDVWLVPTGPLTNIAMALRREPRIRERVLGVVLMGGAYTRGNTTPAAEFNIAVDPEAARIVFETDWDVTMVGLDLTHQALATPQVMERIRGLGSPLSTTVLEFMEFFTDRYRQFGSQSHPPVHDPCAVARIARPDLIECVDAFVAVETEGLWTSGMTVTDFRERPGRPFNTKVATHLDFEGFWDLVIDALARLDSGEEDASPEG